MSAVLKPFCTKTLASEMKTITRAMSPKSLGRSSRASTMDTTNCTPLVPQRSMNFQKRDLTIVLVVNIDCIVNTVC